AGAPANTTMKSVWVGQVLPNLLADGSFEQSPWHATNAWVTDDKSNGDQAIEMGWNATSSILRTFPAQPGVKYTVSGRFKRSGQPTWTGFGVDYLDANGNEISETLRSFTGTTSYTGLSTYGYAPAGTAQIRVWVVSHGASGSLKVDDISLRQGSSSTNLISDGGFETGPWFLSNGWQTTDARTGSKALQVVANGRLYLEIPVDDEEYYAFSGQFKMDGLSDWAGFGIDFKDEDGNEIGEVVQQITPGTGYRSFSVAGIAPDDTETIVLWIVTNGGNGSLKVDDVMLNEL
ncbi:MAG: hypothetical protein SH809_00900, partial [Rhodothermales bacterium]|nr:hypothetical protein [Rhodothermales bacterium]